MPSATPIAVNTTLSLHHQPPHYCRRSTDGHAKSGKHGDGGRHRGPESLRTPTAAAVLSSAMVSSAYSRPKSRTVRRRVRNERGNSRSLLPESLGSNRMRPLAREA